MIARTRRGRSWKEEVLRKRWLLLHLNRRSWNIGIWHKPSRHGLLSCEPRALHENKYKSQNRFILKFNFFACFSGRSKNFCTRPMIDRTISEVHTIEGDGTDMWLKLQVASSLIMYRRATTTSKICISRKTQKTKIVCFSVDCRAFDGRLTGCGASHRFRDLIGAPPRLLGRGGVLPGSVVQAEQVTLLHPPGVRWRTTRRRSRPAPADGHERVATLIKQHQGDAGRHFYDSTA